MTQHPLLGATLADRYFVDALLSGGGQALVFRGKRVGVPPQAYPQELRVAIKVPRSLDQWERIRREGDALRKIRSPWVEGLVQTVTLPTGEPALVLEWVVGQPLSDLLPSFPWELEDTERVLEQVCRGLADIHEAGFVMRDLGPQQVMVDRQDDGVQVCIVDLGLQRGVASEPDLTAPGLVAGTPGFIAPEVIRGDKVTAASDVYSVTCLAWLMLSGTRPFAAATVAATHALQLLGVPGAPPVLPPHWEQFEAVLARGMALSPLDRPTGPLEFLEDLLTPLCAATIPAVF